MKRTLSFGLAAVALASLSATPVIAQSDKPDDISGAWRFQTVLFDGDCTMSGAVRFSPAKAAGTFNCALIVETHCRTRDDQLYEYWRVKETCGAKKTGKQVIIQARIDRIESAQWLGKELAKDERANYSPDDFTLTLTNPDEMRGLLHDRVRRVAVKVWRETEKLS